MKVNYIVLGEAETPHEIKMKFGKCEDLEDIEIFKSLYLDKYPNMKFETFKVCSM